MIEIKNLCKNYVGVTVVVDLNLKIVTNYDFLSVAPNYNANISISNSF